MGEGEWGSPVRVYIISDSQVVLRPTKPAG